MPSPYPSNPYPKSTDPKQKRRPQKGSPFAHQQSETDRLLIDRPKPAAGRITERVLLVRALPGELLLSAAEVTVRGGELVNRTEQVERLDDLRRLQPEHLADRLLD